MNRNSLKKILAISTVTILSGVLVIACGRPHGHRMMNPERLEKMVSWHIDDALDELDATPEQRKQIHAIKTRVLAELPDLKKHRDEDRAVVLEQMIQDYPDGKVLHALLDKRIDTMRAFAHQRLDDVLEIHGTLMPAQRRLIVEKVQKHMAKH